MNQLQTFISDKFGEIRSTVINGEPWLVGRDIAIALGYKRPNDALYKHVDEEDKDTAKFNTSGGEQTMTIINEAGLYALIFDSKSDGAREFQRWITSEILPSIYRLGEYGIRTSILNPDGSINGELLIKIGKELTRLQKCNDDPLSENTLKLIDGTEQNHE